MAHQFAVKLANRIDAGALFASEASNVYVFQEPYGCLEACALGFAFIGEYVERQGMREGVVEAYREVRGNGNPVAGIANYTRLPGVLLRKVESLHQSSKTAAELAVMLRNGEFDMYCSGVVI